MFDSPCLLYIIYLSKFIKNFLHFFWWYVHIFILLFLIKFVWTLLIYSSIYLQFCFLLNLQLDWLLFDSVFRFYWISHFICMHQLINKVEFLLLYISSGIKFWLKNHTSAYGNSELNVLIKWNLLEKSIIIDQLVYLKQMYTKTLNSFDNNC